MESHIYESINALRNSGRRPTAALIFKYINKNLGECSAALIFKYINKNLGECSIEVFKNTFRSLEVQGNIFNRPRTKDSTKESFYVADITNDEMEDIISPHLIDASAQEIVVEVDDKPEEENILTQKISTIAIAIATIAY